MTSCNYLALLPQVTEEVRAMMSQLFGAPASNSGVEPLLVRWGKGARTDLVGKNS